MKLDIGVRYQKLSSENNFYENRRSYEKSINPHFNPFKDEEQTALHKSLTRTAL
jgi:hypothetical protein